MNSCISKRSHKAQILERNESLTEDVCFSPPSAQGAQTPSVGITQRVGRLTPAPPPGTECWFASGWCYRALGSRQEQVYTSFGKQPQVPMQACRAWAVSVPCDAVLALPELVSPKDALVRMESSPHVANSPLHCEGCPSPLWPRLQSPSACLWKTTWTHTKDYPLS